MGKVGYATSTFVRPRTDSNADPHSADLRAAQVAINDVARTLTGKKRKDHVQVSDLLKKAKLPSINQVTVKSMLREASSKSEASAIARAIALDVP
jgi:hypothetical protein